MNPAAAPARQPQLLASVTAVDYTTVVQQLYISYFGRAADTGGLTAFMGRLAGLGAMPFQNQTQMTNAEGAIIGAWFQAGAQ